jgi:hypothetical protein
MTEPSNTSSVRDAADLIFAAEELLTLAGPDDLGRVAAAVDRVARAAKALRPNHLDDALEHVAARAVFLSSGVPLTAAPDVDRRRAAAVDALVDAADGPDVDALRERVRGAGP